MADSNVQSEHNSAAAADLADAIHESIAATGGIDGEINRLPTHAKRLLQIQVPVYVTLAAQRKSIQDITELAPGSIIKFDKTCDEPLQLFVGERPIACGEAVKVGDKFGLRISALVK